MIQGQKLASSFRPATLADVSILVVDDSEDMRFATTLVLEDAGFCRVQTARDGMDALDALARARFDLVLSDIQMPRLDGIGFVKQVKADAALRDIPVILTSSSYQLGKLALQNGADDFFTKGQDVAVMIGAVTRFATKALAQDGNQPQGLSQDGPRREPSNF